MKTIHRSFTFRLLVLICALLAGPIAAHAQNLYVSVNGPFINGAGSIAEYTPAGMQTTFASGLDAPRGMAFDSSGNFIVATTATNPAFVDHGRILKFPPLGRAKVVGNAAHSFLQDVVTDKAGNVFVAAIDDFSPTLASTIYQFAPDGTRTIFGSTPGRVFGLAFDSAGNLFAANIIDPTIYKFTPDGTRTVFAGSGAFAGIFPVGLAFDSSGNLFVSTVGNGNDAILEFTPGGMESTFATGLASPRGLAFDVSGNLFVAEALGAPDGDILEFPATGGMSVFASGIDRPEYLTFGPAR